MTKKHFIRLAHYIMQAMECSLGKHCECGPCEPFTRQQILYLADFCQETNPRFNRQLWIDYINGECGPNGGKL